MVPKRGITEEGEDTNVGALGLIYYHNVVTPDNMDWNITYSKGRRGRFS
jgi:hypothetical protein